MYSNDNKITHGGARKMFQHQNPRTTAVVLSCTVPTSLLYRRKSGERTYNSRPSFLLPGTARAFSFIAIRANTIFLSSRFASKLSALDLIRYQGERTSQHMGDDTSTSHVAWSYPLIDVLRLIIYQGRHFLRPFRHNNKKVPFGRDRTRVLDLRCAYSAYSAYRGGPTNGWRRRLTSSRELR